MSAATDDIHMSLRPLPGAETALVRPSIVSVTTQLEPAGMPE